MATYRLWPSTSGGSSAGDFMSVDLGLQFSVTQAGCTFTGWYWWVATGQDATAANYSYRLFSTTNGTTGTLIAGPVTPSSLAANAWNFTAVSPVTLTSGTTYVAVVSYSDSSAGYAETDNYWTSANLSANALTSGPLTAPISTLAVGYASGTGQCSYNEPANTTTHFPVSTFSATNYWLDVQITQTAAGPANPPLYAQPGRTWQRRFQHRQAPLAPPQPPPADPYTANYGPNYGPYTGGPANPPLYAQPGRTWQRRFQHRQAPLTPPPPPPPVTPPVPLTAPVRAQQPVTTGAAGGGSNQVGGPLSRYGRTLSLPGVFSGTGPPVRAANSPAAPVPPAVSGWRLPVARGRSLASKLAAAAVLIPAVITGPVQAKHVQPAAGAAANQTSGTASRYGRVFSLEGAYSGTGPRARPLTSPVTASRPGPARYGRVEARTGAYSGTGPVVTPLRQPARAKLPQFPVLRGRNITRLGVFSGTGPQPRPLTGPVAAPRPGPVLHGRTQSKPGTFASSGPQVTPLRQPVRAYLPWPVLRGRRTTLPGRFSGSGPHVTALTGPVQARQPLPRRHVTLSGPGRVSGTGPAPAPLRKPVTASVRLLPPHGTIHATPGIYSSAGPPVPPLHRPARALSPVTPLPGRGRTYSTPTTPPPVFVIGGAAATSSALTLPITLTGAAGFGDAVIVGWGTGGTQTVTGVTDTGNNTWRIYNLNTLGRSCGFAVCQPVTSRLTAGNTITLTWSSSQAGAAVVFDVPVGGRVYTDITAGAGVSTGNTSPSVTTPVLSQPNELLLGVIVSQNGGGSPTSPTWPQVAQQHVANQCWLTAFDLLPGATVVPQTLSATITSSLWGAAVLSLAPQQTLPVSITLEHRPPVLYRAVPARAKIGPAGLSGAGPVVTAPALPAVQLVRYGPVQARLAVTVLRGRWRGLEGVFSGTGPPVRPANSPVNPVPPDVAAWRLPPVRGRPVRSAAPAVVLPAAVVPHVLVRAKLAAVPVRGRSIARAGVFSGAGPHVRPLSGPVTATRPGPFRAGRAATRPGVFSGTGPHARLLQQPVQAARLALQPVLRGRRITLPGVFSGTGPQVTPLRQPARAKLPVPVLQGRRTTLPGVVSGTGPQVTALRQPVRAHLPAPVLRGRSETLRGVYAGTGPAVAAWRQPARAHLPAPAVRGRIAVLAGVYSGTGPAVIPVAVSRRARLVQPARGRVSSSRLPAPVAAAPALVPLHAPARAVLAARVTRGTVTARPGVFSGTGPRVTLPAGPVRARLPLQPVPHGRAEVLAGVFSGTGPQVAPLRQPARAHVIPAGKGRAAGRLIGPPPAVIAAIRELAGPVRAKLRVLTGGGRSGKNAGVFSGTGPPVTPLTAPIRAHLPVPVLRGRYQSLPGRFSGTGHAVAAARQPARAKLPWPVLRGRVTSLPGRFSGTGPAVMAWRQPVRAHLPVPVLRGRAGNLPGTHSGTGSQVIPWHQPIRAHLPVPVLRGRIAALAGAYSGAGPPVTFLRHPIRAAIPAVRGGRISAVTHIPAALVPSAPALLYAQPGPAWLKYFRHRQQTYPLPPPPPSAIVLAGPSFTPGLARPGLMTPGQPFAAPAVPLPVGYPAQPGRANRIVARVLRGHGGRSTGTYSGAGPKLTPLRQPVAVRRPSVLPHGRIQTRPGVVPARIAPVRLSVPAGLKTRIQPVRGRITASRLAVPFVSAPVLLRQPAGAPARFKIPAAGSAAAGRQTVSQGDVYASGYGDIYGAAISATLAVQKLGRYGRIFAGNGIFSGTGPPVRPLSGPVTHVRPAVVRGRARQTLTAGPAVPIVVPAARPARARLQTVLVRGRIIQTLHPAAPVAVAVSQAWHGPVRGRARFPARTGRGAAVYGAYSGHGPVTQPLRQPVRARLPLQPVLRGRGMGIVHAVAVSSPPATAHFPFVPGVAWPGQMTPGDPGIYGYAPLYPWTGPVRARLPLRPVLRGRAIATPRYVPPVKVVIPAFKTFFPFVPGLARPGLMGPGQPGIVYPVPFLPPFPAGNARRAPGPVLHGRIRASIVRFTGTGPHVTPLTSPVRARLPLQPVLRGRAVTRAGVFAGTGPAVTPLRAPVTTVRLPVFSRGRIQNRPGRFSGTGPQIVPLRQPVYAKLPVPILRGRRLTLPGVFAGTGPHVRPQTSPARSRPPAVFSRGRSTASVLAAPVTQIRASHSPIRAVFTPAALHGRAYSIAGTRSGTGPQIVPLRQPVYAKLPVPILRGRRLTLPGVFSGTGPHVRPLAGPARSRLPLQPVLRGRPQNRPGIYTGTGPHVTALHTSVRAHLPVPVLRGRSETLRGVYSGTGPPVQPLRSPANQTIPVTTGWHLTLVKGRVVTSRPPLVSPLVSSLLAWHGPVQARPAAQPPGRGHSLHSQPTPLVAVPPPASQQKLARAQPPGPVLHGRTHSSTGVFSGTGPPARPLTGPVRAREPVFAKGRSQALRGIVSATGALIVPERGPVRAPLPGPVLHGRIITRPGMFSGTAPPARLLPGGPVQARRPLPLQGRVIRRAATVSGTGPPVTPLHGPVTAVRPQPTRTGRAASIRGVYSGHGPAVRPLPGPVQARHPLPPRGRTWSLTGTYAGQGRPVTPQTGPTRSRIPVVFSKGRMVTTPPYLVPVHHDVIMNQAGALRTVWQAAPPMTSWQTRPPELP